MEKLVKLEDKEIGLKCSAGTVRAYRMNFGKDMILDIGNIEKELFENKVLGTEAAQSAEEIAYTMAKEYDPSIEPIDVRLDQFGPYFIYTIVSEIIYMWAENIKTLNSTKKNSEKQKETHQQPSSS